MRALLTALLFAFALTPLQAHAQTRHEPTVFAGEIAAFEAADAGAPAQCPVLFVGSSSIRMWTSLSEDMAPVNVLNRGFGGATIRDVNYYFEQTVSRYHPRAIFFYAGENDVDLGESPEEIAADFRAFLALKDEALGATPVYFVSLKPSRLRFAQYETQTQVNRLIRQIARGRRDVHYVDVARPMLHHGQPRDIFIEDGLHMSAEGYAIWTRILRPIAMRNARRACSAG